MLDGGHEEHRDGAAEPEPMGKVRPEAEPEIAAQVRPEAEPGAARQPEVALTVAPEPPTVSLVDGDDHPVDSNAVLVNRIVQLSTTLGIALISFVGVSAGWLLGGIPTWLYGLVLGGWLVVFAGLAFLGYTWPALHHKHLRYRVDETGVRIKRGVVWREIISIPNSRVQHTDVSQGPLQRRYDIATLTVHTAGTEGASIHLDGLRHDVALRLRDHLLPTGHHDAV